MCPSCGFRRHVFWERCLPYAEELEKALLALRDPPSPSDCTFLDVPEIIIMKSEACPSDHEGCGGIRNQKQDEHGRQKSQEEQERERKDSGISGIGEASTTVTSIRSSTADSKWDDCAVSEASAATTEFGPTEESVPSVATDGLATNNAWYRNRYEPSITGTRWRPAGRNITYLRDYVEAGPRELRENRRNMGMLWAVNIGRQRHSRRHYQLGGMLGPDIVRPAHNPQPARPDASVIPPVDVRESNEPDETYLLMKGYHNITEVRGKWEERRRKNPQPERPVVTVTDAVEELFAVQQQRDD